MLILLLIIFFFKYNFKRKEIIVFLPISLSISFSGIRKRELDMEGGMGAKEGRRIETIIQQKLDGINRESFCFVLFLVFLFLKKN